ncbi:MAG TPA: RhuM family protein, partial [Bacteroidia bacterium]|nr:RhuM family protein [Bacteroidia bacterium]
ATQFRIWATKVLKEYLIKGFALDDERLKQGNNLFNKDYFEELLIRIKEIRTSERRFYQKITDIYARCSSDYDVNSPITKKFFATVQNKLEFAITHKTAPEIIKSRANYQAQYMGLNTWKNSPHGRILKTDVSVAKNYLSKKEIDDLNHIVVMYLDYAELQARNHRLMKMQDWVNKLDAFLQFNEFDILKDAGRVKAIVAKSFAEKEFEKYKAIHYLEEEKSDFDKVVEQIKQTGSLPPSAPDQNQETIFSTFNQNLITAVNFNPKDKAE